MMTKTNEYWVVLGAMAAYLLFKKGPDTILSRFTKTGISVGLTLGMSAEVAGYLSISDKTAAILVMAIGLLALDAVTAVASDKKFIDDFLKRKFGK